MFIVIDGPDGSGKTTLSKALVATLRQYGKDAVYTFEPTNDSSAGKKIRTLLQNNAVTNAYDFADLFVVDRQHHIAHYIQPNLVANRYVICDRYKYSALAYQQAQNVSPEYLVQINQGCLVPDITFLLVPKQVDLLMARIAYRGQPKDFFENKNYQEKILVFYRKMPEYFPHERIVFLDAELSTNTNIEKIMKIIT